MTAQSGSSLQFLDEGVLRAAAAAAVTESGLYFKEHWVRDFLVESVVAELQQGGLVSSQQDAHDRFDQLLYENVTGVEPDEVEGFADALHRLIVSAVESAVAELEGSEDDEQANIGGCAMCGRQMPLTFHHLIPRDVHDKYKKKGLGTEQLNAGIDICRPCHSAIHRTYDNKTLAAHYYTLHRLLASEPLQKFVAWARKQKVTTASDITNPRFRYRR
ncbi:hypothetical protein GPECTOR_34g718 [Gonium pectorale]|uniref:HNH domain-containing protein n=1 Tax=Gonium pectorale TaxID=33097 RepID=A0A150GCJ7_GONPE|nr:hypothetical protein GPECTOR_34g718 [Gonium pectorale]|eukprot:KXZ47559.1 hypothetical protein GPECTOR_34g718 [Gonium pectorale]